MLNKSWDMFTVYFTKIPMTSNKTITRVQPINFGYICFQSATIKNDVYQKFYGLYISKNEQYWVNNKRSIFTPPMAEREAITALVTNWLLWTFIEFEWKSTCCLQLQVQIWKVIASPTIKLNSFRWIKYG